MRPALALIALLGLLSGCASHPKLWFLPEPEVGPLSGPHGWRTPGVEIEGHRQRQARQPV